MYDQTVIELLMNRVGWYPAIPPASISLSTANVSNESGRYFNSFHTGATVENVLATMGTEPVLEQTLNDFLLKMKQDVASEIFSLVFDGNVLAQYGSLNGVRSINYAGDYTDVITSKIGLFDQAFGFGVATQALQLFKNSARSNREQRIGAMSYEALTIEVDGVYGEYNKLVSKGLAAKYNEAVKRIIDVLFPTEKVSRPTLTGVHPW